MRFRWCIFLVLTVVQISLAESHFGDAVRDVVGKIIDKCARNRYKNDPALFSKLDGYFYNLYTTAAFAGYEIFKFKPIGDNTVFVRTTNDGECCRTLNITSGDEYDDYSIHSDEDCSSKILEDSAALKLIAANEDEDSDDSYCMILWDCRKSRETVHAFCDKRTVSKAQNDWIQKQFDKLGEKPMKIPQTADYKGGKCFKE